MEKIDYGNWTVPSRWSDITVGQYCQIAKYYADVEKNPDIKDVIHILCNKTVDEVNELPSEFLQTILERLSFMAEKPDEQEPSNKIEWKGETYQVNTQNKLKTGEFIAVETAMKDDTYNYPAILAILCRKEGEAYDSKFENEVLEDRLKMFTDMSVTKVLPVISFFLHLYMLYTMPTQLSIKMLEAIKEERKSIQSSAKSGVISKLYMKWQMRKLKKLENSINSILQTTYNT